MSLTVVASILTSSEVHLNELLLANVTSPAKVAFPPFVVSRVMLFVALLSLPIINVLLFVAFANQFPEPCPNVNWLLVASEFIIVCDAVCISKLFVLLSITLFVPLWYICKSPEPPNFAFMSFPKIASWKKLTHLFYYPSEQLVG